LRISGSSGLRAEELQDAMIIHLTEASRCASKGAHAVLVFDDAGWHTSPKLCVPDSLFERDQFGA
jgi:hypothetical protein